ncbi:ABC-type lipoprotein export system, ATPase component [Microbacterium hydrothermale]|uniref:ABC transporter ATP-binding protein n=1 Tax=Microbacterium hydrothermale TaxID=857427 RepID=UPI0022276C10|nr:ABC transporter ATP-binding protein [Microbacterium hydrothermale]MCW2165524.1 ABC-type lipoprotein export system, ATPase component [Microbacterium hydrothermale]
MNDSAAVEPVGHPHRRSGVDAGAEIECVDLVRIFRGAGVEVQALQGLNLRVERGELTAIVGASGSGKSTLLSILSGLDTASAGRASVAGCDLLSLGARQRAEYRRRVAGFVWQQTGRNFLPALTIRENLDLTLSVGRVPRRRRSARAAEVLSLLDVRAVADRRPGQVTGSERQRAAIALGLANGCRVLFADEPTGELDEASSAQVLEAMRRANDESGVTVLIVTHDTGVADHVRRTIGIRDGRTSIEVWRDRAGGDEAAREYAVLDRAGRLQLPRDHIERLGMRDRVRLQLESDHVRVEPAVTAEESGSAREGAPVTTGPAAPPARPMTRRERRS